MVFEGTEGPTNSSPLVHGPETVWLKTVGSSIAGRRSGGLFHGEVAQGRGGEDLATPHSSGCQERRQGEGEGGICDPAVGGCKDEMIDRVARYRPDQPFNSCGYSDCFLLTFSMEGARQRQYPYLTLDTAIDDSRKETAEGMAMPPV